MKLKFRLKSRNENGNFAKIFLYLIIYYCLLVSHMLILTFFLIYLSLNISIVIYTIMCPN